MNKVRIHHAELDYSETDEPVEKEGSASVGMGAALRPAEEPKKKKGFWRKFWDWMWS